MSYGTRPRSGTALALWVLLALTLGLSWTAPARAQGIRPARDPIVGSRLRHVVEMIPGSNTDLPPFLRTPKDVYLLVTAGAAYTEVEVLANPRVSAPSVAQALSSATLGTPLAGQTVTWSADSYSAAQVSEKHSHFGAMRGSNAVPIAPLMVGLRRAGLTPHLLLRVPRFVRTSLPPPPYSTKTFLWYDAGHLAGQTSVTGTAALSPAALIAPLSFLLAVPVICLVGLWLAGFLSSRGRRDDTARRQVFNRVNSYAAMASMLALFSSIFPLIRAPALAALADLWFGSSSVTIFVPYLAIAAAPLVLFLILARKQETRRFGVVVAGPAVPIPMSDEEKAVRKRVAQYSVVPHIVGMSLVLVALFAVPRTSPLYSFVHPVAQFLPVVGAGLVPWLFKKRLDKFTQKTLDDGLTWRARQLGQMLGVRMPDVFVEDSSRAAHLASAAHQGHHITLSRKLQATFTAAETDFVLAYHLACMNRRTGISANSLVFGFVFPLPMFLLITLVLVPRLMPGGSTTAAVFSSSWFFPAMFAYLAMGGLFMTAVVMGAAKRQAKQDADADRDALEATGNLAAAESALDKLGADAAISPEAQAVARLQGQFGGSLLGGGLAGKPAKNAAQLETGRLMLRRLALQQTAQTLRFAPAPGAKPVPADLSPFSSPSKAEQAE